LDTLEPHILAAFYELKQQRNIQARAKVRIEELKAIINPALENNMLIDPVTGTMLLEKITVKKEMFDREAFYGVHKELYESFCNTTTEERFIIKDKD